MRFYMPWAKNPYRVVGEGLLVLYLLWIGANILIHDHAMATRAYDGLLRIAPENSWGIWMIEVALAHMLAMAINGSRWWTPFIRVVTAAMIALFTAAIAVEFGEINAGSTATANYTFISLGATAAAMAAAWDCGRAWARWWHAES